MGDIQLGAALAPCVGHPMPILQRRRSLLRIILPFLFRSTVLFKLVELDTAVSSLYSVGCVYGTLS